VTALPRPCFPVGATFFSTHPVEIGESHLSCSFSGLTGRGVYAHLSYRPTLYHTAQVSGGSHHWSV